MLIVVEGVSAAGKTTWASRHASAVINEATGPAPNTTDTSAVGMYWSDKHSERWQSGLELEHMHAVVCFDTDPLKMHYPWCLWQTGQSTREVWMSSVEASRVRVAEKQLGFADRVILLEPPEDIVREQKIHDATRRRSSFEAHLRLRKPLRHWYELLEDLSPGTVVFNGHQTHELIPAQLRANRYSLQLFDSLIKAADHLPSND
jgi:AAA domain